MLIEFFGDLKGSLFRLAGSGLEGFGKVLGVAGVALTDELK